MTVLPDYRGFRIEINAVAADGRSNAEVRIRGALSPAMKKLRHLKRISKKPRPGATRSSAESARCDPGKP